MIFFLNGICISAAWLHIQNGARNVIQSLKSGQQLDYLLKCAGLKLIACWNLNEHHIIIIIIKNITRKISIEFPGSVSFEELYSNFGQSV